MILKPIVCVASKKHDDVIKWKHFLVTGTMRGESIAHRWIPFTIASDTPGALMFSLTSAWSTVE